MLRKYRFKTFMAVRCGVEQTLFFFVSAETSACRQATCPARKLCCQIRSKSGKYAVLSNHHPQNKTDMLGRHPSDGMYPPNAMQIIVCYVLTPRNCMHRLHCQRISWRTRSIPPAAVHVDRTQSIGGRLFSIPFGWMEVAVNWDFFLTN